MQEMNHMIIINFLLQFHVIKKILMLWQTVVIRLCIRKMVDVQQDNFGLRWQILWGFTALCETATTSLVRLKKSHLI